MTFRRTTAILCLTLTTLGSGAWLAAVDPPTAAPATKPSTAARPAAAIHAKSAPATKPATRPAAAVPSEAARRVLAVPNLVAFWDFREDAGQPRASLAAGGHALVEMNGPVARVAEGPFGSAIHVKPQQWLRVPREKLGRLDVHGDEAQVTVVAWVKRERVGNWQAVAGVWDESRKKRQYCLFLSAAKKTDFNTMTRTDSTNLFQGHVSAVGGPTPGHEFCITYASSGTPVPMEGWHCLAMTYDAKHVSLYRDGKLDPAEASNPFPYPDGLFDGGADGAEFTVGAVSVRDKPGNFFGGKIGGLAIFDRALTAEEIAKLPPATNSP